MEEVKNFVTRPWMEGEIGNFINVWLFAYLSLCYCYFSTKIVPFGCLRLAAFLPVVALFLLLPLHLHSIHLGGLTAFFLAWLANFKLLMLAFDRGPLSHPSISLLKFLALASLPIRLLQSSKLPSPNTSKSIFNLAMPATRVMLLALTTMCFKFDHDRIISIHPWIIMAVCTLHLYLALETILAIASALARALLLAELEPQFDEPYLSASLQDFWGNRWNLMATGILRCTVYLPVLGWSTALVGRKWAPLMAVMSTFLVSGLIHELIFYYLGRMTPTGEIMCFFSLHGACLAVEIAVKKVVNGRWQMPRFVGTILTIGFVMVTGFWLFFPQLLRCNAVERSLAEVGAVAAFLNDVARELINLGSQCTILVVNQTLSIH